MNSITSRQDNVDLFSNGNEFHFEYEGEDRALPSIDKVHAFFQEKCSDTLKLCQGGKREYHHFIKDEVVVFDSKKMLRKTLSQESGGAWVEKQDGKKRFFVDESGWFNTSYKQVSKEEFLQRLDSPSTMQKVLGIGLGILTLLPGALEIKERLPLKASEAGIGLLALQQKSPLLGAFGFSLLPISVEAQAMGTEFQVNNYTTSFQQDPAIAPLNDGGFVVAWESSGQDGNSGGIFAQRYDATGALFGSEFQVNSYTTRDQEYLSIAPLKNGGFAVAWTSTGQDGDSYGIFAQRYDASGALFGSEFQVNNYTISWQQDPAIAPLDDGGFVIAWQSLEQDGDSYGIFAQRYDASGTIVGSEFQVNNYTTSWQQDPAIAPLDDGGFVIAWQSLEQDGDLHGIFAQRYNATGALLGSEFQVNNYTASDQGYPAIAPLDDGSFVIAWQSLGQDGDSYGIFAQRYNATWALLGSEFQVNNYTASDQGYLAVASLNDGGFVVAWMSNGQDGDGYGIFAQRYNATGALLGSEFQVNKYTASDQRYPAVASLNDGGFVVAWESSGQDGDGYGIFAQRYDRNGNPIPLTYVSSMSSASALSSNSGTTNFPSSQLSPTSSLTTGNSALSSSPISSTPSSSITPTESILSDLVESSGVPTTTSLRPSSTSGMQTTLLSGSSSLSSFEVPELGDVVYGESYTITQNGLVIGTYSISGGTGLYSSGNSNVLEIQLDQNHELQNGDTITLFIIPEGQEEPVWEDVILSGGDESECISTEGVFVEDPEEHSYQVVFNLEPGTCNVNEGPTKLSTIPVLATGGLI